MRARHRFVPGAAPAAGRPRNAARRRALGRAAGWAAALASALPAPGAAAAHSAVAGPVRASARAWAAAAALSRGINLSVMAAPREGDWGLRFDPRWLDAIAQAGFRAVRLPVRFGNQASTDAAARLDEAFAARIDGIVDGLLARGLSVVLTLCCYSQLDGRAPEPGERPVPAALVRPRFVALWRQLARRYANRSPRLLFELYNKPAGDPAAWNALAGLALAAVRHASPARCVVIAPIGGAAAALPQLVLPADPDLLVMVHDDAPQRFTRQGLPWVPGAVDWVGTGCCDAAQQAELARSLDLAHDWSRHHGYPVWLGLFGAASMAAQADRARYLRAVREAAESRGLPWAHADLATNFNLRPPALDAGMYDVVSGHWLAPLLDALLGR
jgi:endoglucanase